MLDLTPKPADPRFARLRVINRELQAFEELEVEADLLRQERETLRAELRRARTAAQVPHFESRRVYACVDPFCGVGRWDGAVTRVVDPTPSIQLAA